MESWEGKEGNHELGEGSVSAAADPGFWHFGDGGLWRMNICGEAPAVGDGWYSVRWDLCDS